MGNKNSGRKPNPKAYTDDESEAILPNLPAIVLTEERGKQLSQFLQVPAKGQAVLLLRQLGHTYDQIADTLKVTKQSVHDMHNRIDPNRVFSLTKEEVQKARATGWAVLGDRLIMSITPTDITDMSPAQRITGAAIATDKAIVIEDRINPVQAGIDPGKLLTAIGKAVSSLPAHDVDCKD